MFRPARGVILPCTSISIYFPFYQVGLMLAGMGGSVDVFRMVISTSYIFCLFKFNHLLKMIFYNKLNSKVRKQGTTFSQAVILSFWCLVRPVHAGRKDKPKSW